MFLLAHETIEDANASAEVLRALGTHARRLLEECVAASFVTRKQLSAAAKVLETTGFVFVRDESTCFDKQFHLASTLAGEEALEALEELENSNKADKAVSKP